MVAAPLTVLLRKNVKFRKNRVWTKIELRALEKLKTALSTGPVMAHPKWDEGMILRTDACKDGLGACIQNADGHPIAYASKSLTEAESRWPT